MRLGCIKGAVLIENNDVIFEAVMYCTRLCAFVTTIAAPAPSRSNVDDYCLKSSFKQTK